ncbi:DUF3501 family protein [Dehalococcoidia bacterium]|nr:DUF3501 family protein [Dehalococcoidia bacterium]
MKKLERSDIKDIVEYEKIRTAFREEVIQNKQHRRVTVGPSLTFIFENRNTVLFQIEEIIRAERLVHENQILEELAVYNTLIPDESELSSTLLIEITNKRKVKTLLNQFIGLDSPNQVWLEFGKERVEAQFEQGRSTESKISAVHFLRFPFSTEQAIRFRDGNETVFLTINHPSYKERTALAQEVHTSLARDLEA